MRKRKICRKRKRKWCCCFLAGSRREEPERMDRIGFCNFVWCFLFLSFHFIVLFVSANWLSLELFQSTNTATTTTTTTTTLSLFLPFLLSSVSFFFLSIYVFQCKFTRSACLNMSVFFSVCFANSFASLDFLFSEISIISFSSFLFAWFFFCLNSTAWYSQ